MSEIDLIILPGTAKVDRKVGPLTAEETRERIQHYSERLKNAQQELESATPNSNRQKKAKAAIAMCKKKLMRLQKDLKKAA